MAGNVFDRNQLEKKENDAKIPVTLDELMPTIHELYDNFYDINLEIYRAKKDVTIIDFRYYPKTSLDEDYREKVKSNPPILHCKVAHPFWLTNPKDKFDINWKHDEGLNKLRRLWLQMKLKVRDFWQPGKVYQVKLFCFRFDKSRLMVRRKTVRRNDDAIKFNCW